ncbi:MAG: hypothetical protein ACREDY_05550 [Bradyrhizobium sp.]
MAARISMANDNGQEYFAIVPVEGGKAWRDLRAKALDELDEAIERGDPPGQVAMGWS